MNKFLKIEWWNDHDLGDVVYQSGFRNILYLDVQVDEPEYQTTIESDLNGDNQEITKFRKWEKVYHFKTWAQEDLVDAFTFMQIHDNIEITMQTGQLIEVEKHRLRAEVKWESIGCLAEVDVTFTEDYVVAGNCDENKSTDCICEVSGGNFAYIALPNMFPIEPDGTYALGYSVIDIAGKKLTAALYVCNSGVWALAPVPEQYTCWNNTDAGSEATWMWDGQYWQLYPGYLISLVWTGAGELTITGYALPGTFVEVYYRTPAVVGVWSITGDAYSGDEFSSGIVKTGLPSQSHDVKVNVKNHSCDYGYTELMTISAP